MIDIPLSGQSNLFHLLFYFDGIVGIVVLLSFIITRMLKHLL